MLVCFGIYISNNWVDMGARLPALKLTVQDCKVQDNAQLKEFKAKVW